MDTMSSRAQVFLGSSCLYSGLAVGHRLESCLRSLVVKSELRPLVAVTLQAGSVIDFPKLQFSISHVRKTVPHRSLGRSNENI